MTTATIKSHNEQQAAEVEHSFDAVIAAMTDDGAAVVGIVQRINAASERARQEHAELLQFREDSRRPGWPS